MKQKRAMKRSKTQMRKNIAVTAIIADITISFGIAGGIECETISLCAASIALAACFVVMFVSAIAIVNTNAVETEAAFRRSARRTRVRRHA